ncbi:YeiH family protein [Fusibacter bizertensis]|uniref:YeiH family protein n=1 Tax=Fusibacter bizertensis TaxID=1488331 RepID=A0ABT6NAJ6_9FIRM|nr:YeiH family protein [Fusibacter bizertensis]MDH8677436.1 YeiH family protein [Fusibacter bizertensis]
MSISISNFTKAIPGILLCLIIALPAWFLGKAYPIIGGPVFGILFGMLLTLLLPNIAEKKAYHPLGIGIKYTSKKILQYAIILLGFEMNLFNIIKVGGQSLLVMIFTLSAAFITAYFVGNKLGIKANTTVLIGVGTSICGGSAIAATAPVIEAEDDEVAHAISTIFLFNIIAVFIFPFLGRLLGMSDLGFGMWAGTAINDTSSVVAAAASWSSAAGNNTALTFATIVKLTRTLMIVPITLVLAIYTSKKKKRSQSGDALDHFSFVKIFPWFIIGFIGTAVIGTFLGFSPERLKSLGQVGKFMIVMAMTAIGLNTHLKKLISNGFKPILLGLCCWFVVAIVSLIVQVSMNFI